jgi:hypothetical protein
MKGCAVDAPVEIKICEKLHKENSATSLVLVIVEGGCSECINAEFQNLQKNEEHIDSLIVVGIFSKQRYFDACVNSIVFNKPLKKVYINKPELEKVKVKANLFYFVYKKSPVYNYNSFSNIFYPEACIPDLTAEYYSFVKNEVLTKKASINNENI